MRTQSHGAIKTKKSLINISKFDGKVNNTFNIYGALFRQAKTKSVKGVVHIFQIDHN